MIQGPENFARDETPEPKRRLNSGRRRSLQAVPSSAPSRAVRTNLHTTGAPGGEFSHFDSVQLLREFERTGNSAPFEELVRRYTPVVYSTCLRVTRDAHDAEDATQATFLTLAAKGRLNGEIHAPEAWLRKVGHRLSLDLIRSKKRRNNRENLRSKMTSEVRPIDSSQSADNSETKSILHEELAKLPAGYRMPLILHYFGGLSREEMSDQLRIKPSTLGVRLHRAREQLKKRMARRGINMPLAALTIFLGEAVRQRIADSIVSQCSSSVASMSSNGLGSIGTVPSSMVSSTLIANSVRDVLAAVTTGKIKIGALVLMGMLSFGINAPSIAQLVPEEFIERIKQIRFRDFITDFQPKLTRPMQVDVPRLVASNEPVVKPIESTEPRSIAQSNKPIYIPITTIAPSPIVNEIEPVVLASIGASDAVAPSFSVRLPAPTRIEPPSPATTQQPITTHRSFAAISSPSNSQRMMSKGNRVESASAQIVPDRSSSASASAFRVGETRANGRRASDGKNVGAAIIAAPVIEPREQPDSGSFASNPEQAIPSTAIPPKPPKVTIEEPSSTAASTPTTTASAQSAPSPTSPSAGASTSNANGASANPTGDSSFTAASSRPTPLESNDQNRYSISSINIEQSSRGARTNVGPAMTDEPERVSETIRFSGTPDAFGGYDFTSMNADQLAEAAEVLQGKSSLDRAAAAPINPFDLSSAANSVKVVLHDQTSSGSTIDFIKQMDTASLGLPPLPEEHTFFGLWRLDSAGEFSRAEIEVRYDDILASRLGLDEHWVKLWVCDGSNWNLLMNSPDFGRDTDRNLVWASAGDFEYFAVSTPEPTMLGVVFGSMIFALGRRRSS